MFPSASRSCLKSSIRLFPTMITASIKAGITKNAKPMNNPKINRKESTIANGLLRNRIFLLFGKSFFSIGRMGTLKMRANNRKKEVYKPCKSSYNCINVAHTKINQDTGGKNANQPFCKNLSLLFVFDKHGKPPFELSFPEVEKKYT